MTIDCKRLLGNGGAAVALLLLVSPVRAQTIEQRQARGDAVVRSLNGGEPQPMLEQMRADFPFLARATEGYALGEVWGRPDLDDRTRQIIAVAMFAALGEPEFMKVHAGYALNVGVTEAELKEIVYLTTATAGFPRAITASRVLTEMFAEHRASGERGRKPRSPGRCTVVKPGSPG